MGENIVTVEKDASGLGSSSKARACTKAHNTTETNLGLSFVKARFLDGTKLKQSYIKAV